MQRSNESVCNQEWQCDWLTDIAQSSCANLGAPCAQTRADYEFLCRRYFPESGEVRKELPASDPSSVEPADVFFCYRRKDGHFAGRVYQSLEASPELGKIVRDIDTFPAGRRFPAAAKRSIAQCDVVLAVVGENWVPEAGSGRLIDHVYDELQTAIELEVPILVAMSEGIELPNDEPSA